ncbi:unnamed protein product [Toxocara canis]|uniref:Secreted protein n=1 Tax=Toxocara canis TaxID=6265 RepID=A0A183V9M3_TOXCA|nr:unnamed protein product [Toxocara canis]
MNDLFVYTFASLGRASRNVRVIMPSLDGKSCSNSNSWLYPPSPSDSNIEYNFPQTSAYGMRRVGKTFVRGRCEENMSRVVTPTLHTAKSFSGESTLQNATVQKTADAIAR